MPRVPEQQAEQLRKGARRFANWALVRAFVRFDADGMTHHAAALAYFAMLSMLPALLLGVSLLGMLGEASLATQAADYLTRHGADQVTARAIRNVLNSVLTRASSEVATATLFVSLLLALNGASGGFGAARRALNVVNRVDEARGIVHQKLMDLMFTAAVLLLLTIALIAVFLGGQVTHDLFGRIGLGDTAAAIWSIVRWPVALLAALTGYAIVYTYSPDLPNRRFRILTPGAVGGVLFWIAASIGLSLYVRNVPNYGAAYGTAGAATLLLLWLWLSANALLYGAELNAELERRRKAPTGPPAPLPPPTAERPIPTLPDETGRLR